MRVWRFFALQSHSYASMFLDWLALLLSSPSVIFSELLVSGITFSLGCFIGWFDYRQLPPIASIAPLFALPGYPIIYALLAVAFGVFHFTVVICRSQMLRKLCAYVATLYWIFTTVVVLSNSLYTIATIFFPALVITCAYSYLRLQALETAEKQFAQELQAMRQDGNE